jgi:superfamily I DNA/RNA helicase
MWVGVLLRGGRVRSRGERDSRLDASQRAVVEYAVAGGDVLVEAGPGSGKTRCVSHRVAFLLDAGVDAETIEVVTYSRRCADELGRRIAAAHPGGRAIRARTLHALGLGWLRRHERVEGAPLGAAESRQMIAGEMRRIPGALDIERWCELVEQMKSRGMHRSSIEAALAGIDERFAELFARFEARKREEGRVDFADMIWRCREELRCPDAPRPSITHLIVDEAQDLDPVQLDLVRLLGARAQVMLVGDPHQSIYGFRGAAPQMLERLADALDARRIRLRRNYRCARSIVRFADALLESDGGGQRPVREARGAVRCELVDDEDDEARFVAAQIGGHLEAGVAPGRIAVLYRTNAQMLPLRAALAAEGIPCVAKGAAGFMRRPEVVDAVAYLRLGADPGDLDALERVLHAPPRGLGGDLVDRLRRRRTEHGADGETSVVDELEAMIAEVRGARARRLVELAEELSLLVDRVGLRPASLLDQVFALYDRTGTSTFLECHRAAPDGRERERNLRALRAYASGFASVVEMLGTLSTSSAVRRRGRGPREAVQLMTAHRSKGLEFAHVYVVGAVEGTMPLDGPAVCVEEERRIFYVASTRAEESLTVTVPRRWCGRAQRASRFLEEVAERAEAGEAVSSRRSPARAASPSRAV